MPSNRQTPAQRDAQAAGICCMCFSGLRASGPYCLPCKSAYDRAYRERKGPQPITPERRARDLARKKTPQGRAYSNTWKKQERIKDPEKVRERERARYHKTRGWENTARYLGVSTPDLVAFYETRIAACGGMCEGCGQPPEKKRLHVDHDHTTKALRGLLCSSCNLALGYARDNPGTLRTLAAYLETRS